MILSVPIHNGYAYFSSPSLQPTRAPRSNAPPIESIAPLLPLDSSPISTGSLAKGQICYPQNTYQLQQIARMEPPPATPTEPAKEEWNLVTNLGRGLLISSLVGLILWQK